MVDHKQVQVDLMRRFLGVQPRTSEDQVLRLTVETGVRAVGADEGSLTVFDPEANELMFLLTYGNEKAEAALVGTRIPLGQTLMGLAAQTGEVQIGAPRYKDSARTEAMSGVQALIAAPMMVGDRLIGVISAISNQPDKRFTMEDGDLYGCLATIAALVVNQSLTLKSLTDGTAPADLQAATLAGDPLEQEVLERVGRLLRRDRGVVRQVARMLEAMEAMAPAGLPQ